MTAGESFFDLINPQHARGNGLGGLDDRTEIGFRLPNDATEDTAQAHPFELVVQVNGKVRDRVEVGVELSEAELIERAKELPNVQSQLDGKKVRDALGS